MTIRTALAAGLLGLLCASAPRATARSQDEAAAPPRITGTVTYREKVALPPDAIVQVRLDDASQPEMPAKLVAETTVPTAGKQVPISFELPYRAADIVPNRRYVVRAKIVAGGKTLFSSKTPYPVLTRGAPTKLEILVQQSGGGHPARPQPAAPSGGAGLVGVEWWLVELGAAPAIEQPGGQKAHFVLNAEKKSLSGSTGCNQFFGGFELVDGGLLLTPAGMTLMACPEDVMRQEQALLAALKAATGYRITGESLELLEGDGHVLARLVSSAADGAAQSH
jgi:putative lipoprotein